MQSDVAAIPGVVDVRLQQVPRTPDIRVNVDRTLADQVGVTQKDVATDLLTSLSSSNQTSPNFWLNPQNGVNYSIFVQTPQYDIRSMNDLDNTPIVAAGATPADAQLLGNLATVARGTSATNITHSNISPTFDVLMGVQGADLGSVAKGVQRVIDGYQPQLPTRLAHYAPRPDREHAVLVQRPDVRPHLRRRPRLPADGRKLPVVARPADYPHGAARRRGRHPLDALGDPDHDQRPCAHGRDHEHRRCHRQQHPHDHVCQRPARARPECPRRRAGRRTHPPAPRRHDGPRDDHRHAPDVTGSRRRR